ncbi:hypothetical protein L21SP3_01995 [Sedimentisphaera cyanobacteriorum]|uniref:Cupin type-2 domain-containing protein n=1 Tax=Sedimentisphaera cyanobacteriorum TaxID=1940790 RepID=A0A1Q2HRT7_9BACT|nr:cupin domain-containing protein [Sedimentisphaera cyanobacteriorum]AQQ10167.1 hypothetical protein L21SP3_01995 [Sedimentisphaera cyanobacteriorum]
MIITKTKDTPFTENPHKVKAQKLYDKTTAQIIHLTLEQGESLRKHITPVDVAFYVLEGKGLVEIGEESHEAEKDDIIESPKNIPHRWINTSDEKLRILVIKTPAPTSATRIL